MKNRVILFVFTFFVPFTISGQNEPVTMKYNQSEGTVNRYIFSQRGWQEMSPVSEGNVFAGFLEQKIINKKGNEVTHELKWTDLSVHYLIPKQVHVKQPSEMMVDVPVPVKTKNGQASHIALPTEETAKLPALAGIGFSSLRADLPILTAPLAPKPIRKGDTWTVKEHGVHPTVSQRGNRENRITADMTYKFDGFEDRPTQYRSQEKVKAMKITGIGSLLNIGSGSGPQTEIKEKLTFLGYFDHQNGKWLEIKYISDSEMKGKMGDRTFGGPMGFTNDYVLLSTK